MSSKITLLPHNIQAFEKVLKGWKSSDRVAVVHPTGSGKGYLILGLAEYFSSAKKVILAPTDIILDELRIAFGGKLPSNTVVLTYAGLSSLVKKGSSLHNFDYIFLDEFHRCGAENWGLAVKALLDSSPSAKILGTSATPIRYLDSERDMSDELFEGNIVSSMTLAEAIANGILPAPKYISAVYRPLSDLENTISKIESKAQKDQQSDYENSLAKLKHYLEYSIGIPTILKRHIASERKFLVFCSTLKHMNLMKQELHDWFKKAFPEKSVEILEVLYTKTNNNEEIQKFRDSTADITLLFSIDILIEGLHVESTDGVILLRPTVSPRVFLQQIGRGLSATNTTNQPLIFDFVQNIRTSIAKQFGYEILHAGSDPSLLNGRGNTINPHQEFVLYDYVEEFESELEKFYNKYAISWDVYFNLVKDYKEKTGSLPIGNAEINELRVGSWLGRQRYAFKKGKLPKNYENKLDSLDADWKVGLDEKWERYFNLLKEYVETHGVLPSQKLKYKGTLVGMWVQRQWTLCKDGVLDKEKEILLDSLNVNWRFDKEEENNKQWLSLFHLLQEFVQEHKRLPLQSEEYKDVKLGVWLNTQKTEFNRKKLLSDREHLLNTLNLPWQDSKNDRHFKIWVSRLESVKEYYLAHNRFPVSGDHKTDIDLGSWLTGNLSDYRRNKLSENRATLFKPVFELYDELSSSSEVFNALEGFVSKFNRPPLYAETFNDIAIGRWLSNKRGAFNGGKLGSLTLSKLDSIMGTVWRESKRKDKWTPNFKLLSTFVSVHNRLPKSAEKFRGVKLGQWLVTQRTALKVGSLSKDREESLNKAFGVIWQGTQKDTWTESFNALIQFVKKFNRYPKKSELYNDTEVGAWFIQQRNSYNMGRMGEDKILLLNQAFGSSWREAKEDKWTIKFNFLLEFVNTFNRYPKYNESIHGESIGTWYFLQRTNFRKGKLLSDRLKLLDTTFSVSWRS